MLVIESSKWESIGKSVPTPRRGIETGLPLYSWPVGKYKVAGTPGGFPFEENGVRQSFVDSPWLPAPTRRSIFLILEVHLPELPSGPFSVTEAFDPYTCLDNKGGFRFLLSFSGPVGSGSMPP
eukprot:Gb_29803 [translate_table: standard]